LGEAVTNVNGEGEEERTIDFGRGTMPVAGILGNATYVSVRRKSDWGLCWTGRPGFTLPDSL